MIYLHRRYRQTQDSEMMDHGSGLSLKLVIVYLCIAILAGGLLTYALSP